MSWTKEKDVLFSREILVTNPFKHKFGSRERGSSWDLIATSLNSLGNPIFKVDQRSLRDHLNKLLRDYSRKQNQERRASGVEVEVEEIDVLLEEITQLKNESELMAKTESEEKANKAEKEIAVAKNIRQQCMETWSESKKRAASDTDVPDAIKRKRNNGNETIDYLREKSQKDLEIKQQELELKQKELDFQREKERVVNNRTEHIFAQFQRHNEQMLALFAKLAEKL